MLNLKISQNTMADKVNITNKMRDFEKVRKVINSCITVPQMSGAWKLVLIWHSRYHDYAMHMMHVDWWSDRNDFVLKRQRYDAKGNACVIDFSAVSDSEF